MPRYVVLGGTFNPLSIAHHEIIHLAKEKIGAKKIILLPTPDSFLKKWKNFDKESILDERIRLKILEEYSSRHKDVIVDRTEIDGHSSHTYESLEILKKKYRTKDIFFVMGSEKAEELDKWYESSLLVKNNKFILVRRHHDSLQEIKKKSIIKENIKNFVFLDGIEKDQEISSTEIREFIKKKDYDKCSSLTFSYVTRIIKEAQQYV